VLTKMDGDSRGGAALSIKEVRLSGCDLAVYAHLLCLLVFLRLACAVRAALAWLS
jgi:hypothetical protein